MVIEHMSKGFSFESFAGVVECSKETLYEWRRVHQDFSDAVGIAFAKCQIFWESQGIDGLWNSKDRYFSQNSWNFNMRNRFKWKDTVEVEAGDETKNLLRLAYKLDE